MAHLFTKIYKVLGAEPRCRPGCGRTLNVAIAEQVEKQEECPLGHCKFKKEIKDAILLSKTPEIIHFSTNKTEILDTETITISWELLNVKNCSLKGFGHITDKDTRHIELKKTTDLILEFEAFNGDIYNTEALRVKVLPAPELTSFSISNTELIKDDSSKIAWEAKNIIESILLINGIETSVRPNDSIEIIPEVDSKIELKLIGHLDAEISQIENINVYEPALLKSFTTDKSKVLDKESVRFVYDVENASRVFLVGASLTNRVDITDTNEYQLSPHILNNHSITQTYYLEVFDKVNNPLPKVPISIEVFPHPAVLSFTISKEKILIGDEIELKWSVLNFSNLHLQIDNELINVGNQTSFSHEPRKATEYKLIVDGLEHLKTIESLIQRIQVFHYVEIDFSVDKTHTVQTAPVNLAWNVKNATNVYMNELSNTLSNSGNMIVHPNETMVYKIVASNDLDEESSEIRINVFSLPVIEKFTFPKFPNLTPKLQETFTGSASENGGQFKTTILPPQNLNKKITNRLFDFVNNKSIKSGKSLHSNIISKNISSEDILTFINQRINNE
jgi:hypothetical protein